MWVVLGYASSFLKKVLHDGNLGLKAVVIEEPASRSFGTAGRQTQIKYLK
jgi:hypothetical protein